MSECRHEAQGRSHTAVSGSEVGSEIAGEGKPLNSSPLLRPTYFPPISILKWLDKYSFARAGLSVHVLFRFTTIDNKLEFKKKRVRAKGKGLGFVIELE